MSKHWKYWAIIGLGCLILLGSLLFLVAQPGIVPQPFSPPTVNPDQLKSHVKYLSVDLYPRSFEQARNLEQAADYIATAFKTNGGSVSRQRVDVEDASYENIIAR